MRRLLLGVLVGVVAFSLGLIGVNEAVGRDHKKNNSRIKPPRKITDHINKIEKMGRKAKSLERSFHNKMEKNQSKLKLHDTTHRNAMQKAHQKFEAVKRAIDKNSQQKVKKINDSMRKIDSVHRKKIDNAWTSVKKMANKGRGLCNDYKKDIRGMENKKRKIMRSKVSGKDLGKKTKKLAHINNRIGQMYSGEKKCVKMMSRSTRRPSPKHRGPRVKVPGRHGTGGVAGPRHPGPRKGMPRPRKGQNPPKN